MLEAIIFTLPMKKCKCNVICCLQALNSLFRAQLKGFYIYIYNRFSVNYCDIKNII